MSRFDLAHVDPSDSGFDALGKGATSPAETQAPGGAYLALFAAAGTNATVTVVPD